MAKVRSVAACSVLMLRSAAAAAAAASAAYPRRQGPDLRSYDALFTVEPCFGRCCGAETAIPAW